MILKKKEKKEEVKKRIIPFTPSKEIQKNLFSQQTLLTKYLR